LLISQADAAQPGYELYLLACDGVSDCRRVADVMLGADGQTEAYGTPGVSIRIDPLAPPRDAAAFRLRMNLEPGRLLGAGQAYGASAGALSIQVESSGLRPSHFSPITVFASDRKIYQLWGRLAGGQASKSLALK
jgi:hypothetical protein